MNEYHKIKNKKIYTNETQEGMDSEEHPDKRIRQ